MAAQYTGGVRVGVRVFWAVLRLPLPGAGAKGWCRPPPHGVTSSVPPMPNSYGFKLPCLACAQYRVIPKEHPQPEMAAVYPPPISCRRPCDGCSRIPARGSSAFSLALCYL